MPSRSSPTPATCSSLPGTTAAPYLGSESSVPVFGHWSGLADAQRRMYPDLYRLITQGIGLDGISVPDDASFELRPRLAAVASDAPTVKPMVAA